MTSETCPICGSIKWKYDYSAEECYGIVEQHGRCDRCGFIIEQAYSDVATGFELDRIRGYAWNGKWYGKNTRKRKRLRRKYNIKHTPNDRFLTIAF